MSPSATTSPAPALRPLRPRPAVLVTGGSSTWGSDDAGSSSGSGPGSFPFILFLPLPLPLPLLWLTTLAASGTSEHTELLEVDSLRELLPDWDWLEPSSCAGASFPAGGAPVAGRLEERLEEGACDSGAPCLLVLALLRTLDVDLSELTELEELERERVLRAGQSLLGSSTGSSCPLGGAGAVRLETAGLPRVDACG